MNQKPTQLQAELLKRRGLDPKEYVVVKALYGCIWVRSTKTGRVKIINKFN